MELIPWLLLLVQGVMGGVDTLLNHELIARLPQRPEARTEIGLHVVREAIWAFLFVGLAWFAWRGAFALVIVVVIVAEITITVWDEWVENRTRVLPQNERVLHVFLTLNLGLIVAFMIPMLLLWGSEPTSLVAGSLGFTTWALTLLGLAAGVWSLRDFFAWRRLGYGQEEKK